MRIITTVGTSLVTNKISKNKETQELFEILKQKDFADKDNFLQEYEALSQLLKTDLKINEKTSAEIKSLINIKNSNKFANIDVELIATDTLLSPICAEVLKNGLEKELDIKVNFSEKNIIKDLQVSDYKRYKNGLINLINRLNQFAYNGQYFKDMILNITGGFKGVIPYLTIFGQVNEIPIYYIFEFTNSLITIPQMPISMDTKIFDENWKLFYKLSKESIADKRDFDYEFLQKSQNIIEIDGEFVSFNALGKILWDKYANDHFFFYASDDILKDIGQRNEIKRILTAKFKETVDNKTETKGDHLVYDDGNNSNRIFYFKDNEEFYIYKVFEDHNIYEKYINQNSINKDDFKKISQLRML
jgi:putative CRISPR-associated protein (TIGR02619 family)